MFKRLFFLSGIIAFILACVVMYFWYLPNHQNTHSVATEVKVEPDTVSTQVDSTKTTKLDE